MLVQYFSGAQPVVVINNAELARYAITLYFSMTAVGIPFARLTLFAER